MKQPADPAGACSKHQPISVPSHKGRQGEHRGLSQSSLIKTLICSLPTHLTSSLLPQCRVLLQAALATLTAHLPPAHMVTQGSCCKALTAQPHRDCFLKRHPTLHSLQENLSPQTYICRDPSEPPKTIILSSMTQEECPAMGGGPWVVTMQFHLGEQGEGDSAQGQEGRCWMNGNMRNPTGRPSP